MNPIYVVFSANLATLALKIIAYLNSTSAAVFSDLLNDVADAIGSFLLVLGLYLASRRVRNQIYYPFGISRAVYVFGLISVSVIGGVLFTIAFLRGLATLFEGYPVISTGTSMVTMSTSLLINTALTAYSFYYYRTHRRDPSVIGSLLDSFIDTLGNAVAILALVTRSYMVDGAGSIFISAVLLVSAVSVGYRYFILLIGRSPPRGDMLRILNTIINTPGVYDVNELRAVMLTENDYIVIAEVEVEDSLSLAKMEELSREIENRVKKAVPEVRFFAVELVARRNEPPTYRRLLDLIGRGS